MMPSGRTYALIDFVDRLIPKRAEIEAEYVREILEGLKRLADVEQRNPRVTLDAAVTAGVWVLYRGVQRLLLNPGQRYLRVEAAYRAPEFAQEAIDFFAPFVTRGDIEKTQREDYHQWRVPLEGLQAVWEFVEAFPGPDPHEVIADLNGSHPRYFPGEVRQLALDAFEKDGRVCRGVSGKTQPHRVEIGALIEFDHVLPHSRGGPSSLANIQVLCAECNRIKSDSAW